MYLSLLKRHIKTGVLHLHLPNGKEYSFGSGGTEAHWYVRDEETIQRIARDWEFELGETYIKGGWDAGKDGLRNLLEVLRSNFGSGSQQVTNLLAPVKVFLQQWNRISRSYNNVAAHYDAPESVFRLFLDQEMFYSCAYFPEDTLTLEQAQQAKARHIVRKLLIKPGDRVLDIGCGWGSMAFHLAQHFDCEVTGITLSQEQLAAARREQQRRGVDNVRFELADYREHAGEYDRIVSIGMFEHVGRPYHKTYFECVKRLLKPQGAALIHTIGRSGPRGATNAWIRKHIFPGGSTPALSELATAVESQRLLLADIEVWRLHYAHTLAHWHSRFQQQRDTVRELMGEQFCRMWEFYLTACESAFRFSDLVVYQLQLAQQHGVVPVSRDYLYR